MMDYCRYEVYASDLVHESCVQRVLDLQGKCTGYPSNLFLSRHNQVSNVHTVLVDLPQRRGDS